MESPIRARVRRVDPEPHMFYYDEGKVVPFDDPVYVEICSSDGLYFLVRRSESGDELGDSCQFTLKDALEEAADRYGVREADWVAIPLCEGYT